MGMNGKVVVTSLSVASGSTSANTSMIAPVWLSSQSNPVSEKLVYALLDTQSDTVFIEHAVSQGLNAEKCPVTLWSKKNLLMSTERVSGLRVRGFNSTSVLELPPAYTKQCIPVDHAHIPTSETAKRWKHFSTLADKMPCIMGCTTQRSQGNVASSSTALPDTRESA